MIVIVLFLRLSLRFCSNPHLLHRKVIHIVSWRVLMGFILYIINVCRVYIFTFGPQFSVTKRNKLHRQIKNIFMKFPIIWRGLDKLIFWGDHGLNYCGYFVNFVAFVTCTLLLTCWWRPNDCLGTSTSSCQNVTHFMLDNLHRHPLSLPRDNSLFHTNTTMLYSHINILPICHGMRRRWPHLIRWVSSIWIWMDEP